jgi:membrane protein DedA with SNARE-associated domain
MARKVEFAFTLLRRQENLFILSFRFIYGLRNISPFIIGMTGVSRVKFVILNMLAAVVWANTFAWGGYTLGKVLETYLGESSQLVLAVLVVIILCVTLANWYRQRRKNMAADAAAALANQDTTDAK